MQNLEWFPRAKLGFVAGAQLCDGVHRISDKKAVVGATVQ